MSACVLHLADYVGIAASVAIGMTAAFAIGLMRGREGRSNG